MSRADPPRDWVLLGQRWSRLLAIPAMAIGVLELIAWLAKPSWIGPD
jgi:hypothetical protein